jgi:NADPH:quinone reductase-like Zn-dependent oxidoreductase
MRFIAVVATSLTFAFAAGSSLAQSNATVRQYQFEPQADGYRLALKQVAMPAVGANDVVVRVRATSLNRRDLLMLHGRYGRGGDASGGVPMSDGAGEVIGVGGQVTRFKVGDRVAGIFFARWQDGAPDDDAIASARGGDAGGMLSEIVVSHENGLVSIPEHLSFEEAATLPCAGVTAWVSLFRQGQLQRDEFVLLEGTGGVSVFGLQFAAAAGAKPIITSSSEDKLAEVRAMGAFGTANYRQNPDWQVAVRDLTGGRGVDHVLEVGGEDTLQKALQALAYDGHVALIGGLSGFAADVPVGVLMGLNASVTGIYVGSRADFEAMNDFIAEHKLRPVVDRVFEFEDAPAAFDFMENGSYLGKIVIRL